MPMTRESSKYSNGKNHFDYDNIAIYFTKEEWDCLKEGDKRLYKNVMMENYQMLQILGYADMKLAVISHIEQGKESCIKDYPDPQENMFGLNSRIALKQRRRYAYQRALASWPTETSEDSSDSPSLHRSNSLRQLDMSLSSDESDLSQDLLAEFEYNNLHVAEFT
ncbi:zinc finger 300-like isoform X1 [Pelobates cultripes]|uniref:Zinc finger 300-like isoform X1 n=1 Tax=Pelobates cultripes TaxID=61616 RepID=A0AAD1WGJ0_PELCU|nr:zinc finger 300-like isoform X1 [Pelobates cultripes]